MSSRRQQRKRCEFDCIDHIFTLSKTDGLSRYDNQLGFCPKYQREPLPPQQTYPIFNKDMKYYTSGFILGVDKRSLQDSLQQELMSHQKLVKDSLEKNNQICFPRPNTKNPKQPNCSVCKMQYINYYHHISSNDHKDNIRSNIYNSYIIQLCLNYKQFWQGAQEKADLQYEEQDRLDLENQQEEQFNVEGQEGEDGEEGEEEEGEGEEKEAGVQIEQGEEIKNIQLKTKVKSTPFNFTEYPTKSNETNIKRGGPPLLCELISKKIILNKGETIKPVFTKNKETTIDLDGPPSNPKPIEKITFTQHRGKYFSTQENNWRIKDKEDSQTVVKGHLQQSVRPKYQPIGMPERRNLQIKKDPIHNKPLEPYYEYMKKLHPENPITFKNQLLPNYPRPPTNSYDMYQPWSYSPYYYHPPPPMNADPRSEPHKNPFLGNTSININFPMYVPPYHPMGYPRYTPYSSAIPYPYPPYSLPKKSDQPPQPPK